jgi:hypothetical protein
MNTGDTTNIAEVHPWDLTNDVYTVWSANHDLEPPATAKTIWLFQRPMASIAACPILQLT